MSGKYLQVTKTSWQAGFVYRLSFVMWRVRMVVQFLALIFLWKAILHDRTAAFGYSDAQLLTYIIGTSIIRSLVFSSRSIDAQGEISSGDLSNYLLKPINYFKYWFARDVSDKLLNSLFMVGETIVFVLLLGIPLFIQSNLWLFLLALTASILAMIMYYYFSFLISMTTFWLPEENGWPQRFLVFMLMEFLAGGLFPLTILPNPLYNVVKFLPTAYFLNHPLQIYLGRTSVSEALIIVGTMVVWIVVLGSLCKWVFHQGLKVYGAYGR